MSLFRRRWLFLGLGGIVAFFGYALIPWNKLPEGARADRLVIRKSARSLELHAGPKLLKTYRVSLGFQPVGAKEFEGDGRTSEGRFIIANRNPRSSCYLALRIGCPTAADVARAKAQGRSPGGDIMIHGLRNGLGWLGRWHRWWDWTARCAAVTNQEMNELWQAVRDGTPVEIRP